MFKLRAMCKQMYVVLVGMWQVFRGRPTSLRYTCTRLRVVLSGVRMKGFKELPTITTTISQSQPVNIQLNQVAQHFLATVSRGLVRVSYLRRDERGMTERFWL